jgi:serine/threonine-protein phosphatase 5
VIVGDIHGQFESTLTIFEDLGYPSQRTAYLFNGDIIDRGDKSLECILMIFAYKIALFGQFHVTRGNHESLSCGFGSFYEECQRRLANYPNAFKDFQYAFESLPYGYIVEGKYFVTHGGIGPDMLVKDLKYLFRTEYSYSNHSCLMAMLWNDPCEDTVPVNEYLMAPSGRGKFCMKFHPNLTKIFLDNHGLELLIRSHQVAMEGWELSQYDMCLTIFSAPNYVNIGNRGAVLVVTEEKISIQGMRA